MKYIIGAILGGMLGAGIEFDLGRHDTGKLGLAFGCGRHYASNYDPADDPTDMHSMCYPSYKAWEKSEQWPPR